VGVDGVGVDLEAAELATDRDDVRNRLAGKEVVFGAPRFDSGKRSIPLEFWMPALFHSSSRDLGLNPGSFDGAFIAVGVVAVVDLGNVVALAKGTRDVRR